MRVLLFSSIVTEVFEYSGPSWTSENGGVAAGLSSLRLGIEYQYQLAAQS